VAAGMLVEKRKLRRFKDAIVVSRRCFTSLKGQVN
jgi:hypothetical protein